MASAKRGTRSVVVPVTFQQIAMWKCAAALEPVPPTWLGLSWSEVLATPVDWHRGRMTLDIPSGILAKQLRRLEPHELAEYFTVVLENQARGILDRYGLQRIPEADVPRSDMEDGIPF